MTTPTTPGLAVPATCLPYSQATPQQQAAGLRYVRQELRLHFPTLARTTWGAALDYLQPDWWVETDGSLSLDYQDLSHLVQYLSYSRELPTLDPPIYGHPAHYLAKRLMGFCKLAARVLPELEANPTAYSSGLHSLIATLALGNGRAELVWEATNWPRPAHRPAPASSLADRQA